ncbi:putative disease resistance protein [Vitis vinifera]|uniref:Putative disease resistance protein n=1 Tax=Vitis vinifera TaxID=29760 RepID=A0A438DF93_VITVI|nr:putative disease resistance protein [Vitis vinifera]
MEFLSSIVGLVPCFYDHTSKHTVYIRDLRKNLQALSKEMVDLNNLYEDVKERVERAEQQQMKRRKEVGGWIREVEAMEKEVHEILQRGDQEIQKSCLGCCPGIVAEMLPRPPVDELPMEATVGPQLAYEKSCRKINNEFLATSNDFEVVIWAVVSKSPDIEKIQQVIWNKLEIPRDKWETRSSREEKAAEILRVMKRKRFILLLDDIWEGLDLLEMGVPRPDTENKSKIVLTTRSQDVCHQMKAQKSIEVECLESEDAWTLFRKEVGEEILNSHPDIRCLQRLLLKSAEVYLSLLSLLGGPWQLRKIPQTGTSYDRLPDNASKSCFIYHSMFREDWEIYNFQLVELWIGEGFMGEVHDIHEARDQGKKIIKTLKHACLLESGGSRETRVKIHDVIRDMALWLYGEHGVKKNKILVYNKVARLDEDQETSKLKETEKISLWDMDVGKFPETLLYVEDCESIEEVIRDDSEVCEIKEKLDIFSRLKYLKLNRLPRLKSIYQHPLLFPSLEIIKLKWKDETIKHSFTPYFQIHEAEAYSTDTEESETGSIDDMQEQPGLVLPLLTQLGSELLWLLPFRPALFPSNCGGVLILRASLFMVLSLLGKLVNVQMQGSSRQALVGIHVFAGIGFCGLPLAFDVGWVCFLCWSRWSMVAQKAASNLSVVCRRWNLHGGCSGGSIRYGNALPFSVLGRQLVACVSSAL